MALWGSAVRIRYAPPLPRPGVALEIGLLGGDRRAVLAEDRGGHDRGPRAAFHDAKGHSALLDSHDCDLRKKSAADAGGEKAARERRRSRDLAAIMSLHRRKPLNAHSSDRPNGQTPEARSRLTDGPG